MSHVAPRPPGRRSGTTVLAAVVVVALLLGMAAGLWWLRERDDDTDPARDTTAGTPAPDDTGGKNEPAKERPTRKSEPDGGQSGGDADLGEAAEEIARGERRFPKDPRVVVISIDGLGSLWVSEQSSPTLARLISEGAATLNARTEVEKTVTLPNHTGMVTGDRVDAAQGGHGVTWNGTSSRLVAPGTASVFSVIDEAGGSSAVYAGKTKFEMWNRSWPGAIDDLVIESHQPTLVSAALQELRQRDHDLLFLHLAGPDAAGHSSGWGSPAYLDAVAAADSDVARVVSAVTEDPQLAQETIVIVTADHGGTPGTTKHSDTSRPEDYSIPFLVWGPGIGPADLYALNDDYADPGSGQPGYDDPPPVRNGSVANLVTDLLGLPPVPDSLFNTGHDLDVR